MVESLMEVSKKGVASYANTPREQWVLDWPGQIVLVVTAIYWTREVGGAIAKNEKGSLQAAAE
jgi:dynein heavy chain